MKLHGRVFRGSSGNYWVRTSEAQREYVVRLRGTLKKELVYTLGSRPRRVVSARKRRSTDPVTVGDWVAFDTDTKIIESVAERSTELSRQSPSSHEQHVLVANLATLFCVVSAANPQPNLWILDKFIVVAENEELLVELVVNKIDIAGEGESPQATLRALFEPYARIGYPVHYVSARESIGIAELRTRMAGQIAAFAGNSGVGKSSLLNAIQPGLRLKTGDISLVNRKGKHTTTQAELIPLFEDGQSWLADTPGLRQLDFWEIEAEEVEYGFREVRERASDCQFNNCTHRSEPGCAVQEAVRAGTVDERRWQSYVQLYNEASGIAREEKQ